MSKELSEIVDGVVRRVLEEKSGVSSAQPVKQNTLSKMTLAAARELIKAVETKARDMGVNRSLSNVWTARFLQATILR